jgi:hypothetical protein
MRGILRVGRTAVLGLAVLAALGLAPNASAKTDKCLIQNHALNASYKSLQAAVDAADAGASLDVRGTCRGITTITKSVTITGKQPHGFTGPILDGDHQGSVLAINAGVTVTVDNLTITGGIGSHADSLGLYGGGIYNAGELTIENSVIMNNSASQSGGGIYAAVGGEKTTLTDSLVTDNSAYSAGGIAAGGEVTLTDSVVTSNVATGGRGGGIDDGLGLKTTLTDSTVSDNSAPSGGGIATANGVLDVNGSVISGNTASGSGGGIYDYGVSPGVYLTDSAVSGNSAADAGVGGIHVNSGSYILTRTTVTGNTGGVGGIWITNYLAHGLMLTDSTVTGNIGRVDAGGISVACDEMTATNSTISGNTGGTGGGISISSVVCGGDGRVTLTDSTVSGNSAVQGGGVYFLSFDDPSGRHSSLLTLNDSAITGNTASSDGGGIYGCGTVEVSGTSAISDNDPNDVAGCSP